MHVLDGDHSDLHACWLTPNLCSPKFIHDEEIIADMLIHLLTALRQGELALEMRTVGTIEQPAHIAKTNRLGISDSIESPECADPLVE